MKIKKDRLEDAKISWSLKMQIINLIAAELNFLNMAQRIFKIKIYTMMLLINMTKDL